MRVPVLVLVVAMFHAAVAAQSPAAPPAVAARRVLSSTGPGAVSRVIVIAVDDLSFPPESGQRLVSAAARFVAGAPDGSLVGLVTTSGRAVVNPTSQPRAVADALSRVVGQYRDPRKSSVANAATISLAEAIEMIDHANQAVTDVVLHRECGDAGRGLVGSGVYANAVNNYNDACANEALRAARSIASATREVVDRQVRALTDAVTTVSAFRGVRHVVLLSAGLATTRAAATVRPIGRAATAAGVQMMVVTEDGAGVDLSDSGHTLNDLGAVTYATGVSNGPREDARMLRASLQALAQAAGGRFEMASGNGDAAFARIGEAESPVARTAGLPFRMAVVRRQAATRSSVELGIGLEVPASVPGPVTVGLGVIDGRGGMKRGTRIMPAPGPGVPYRLTLPFAVEAGLYALRVTVTDAAGHAGEIETNVDARLPVIGDMRMSDLLTWWIDGEGAAQLFALDELPAGVAHVWAGVELSTVDGRAWPPDAAVSLSLVPAASADPVWTGTATLRTGRDRTRADVELPVAALPAGDYRLTATVMIAGAPAGRATAVLRKR